MARPKVDNVKWQIVIAKDLSEKVEAIAKATGIGKSALIALALTDEFSKDKWQMIEQPTKTTENRWDDVLNGILGS